MLSYGLAALKRDVFLVTEADRLQALPGSLQAPLVLDFQRLPVCTQVTDQFACRGLVLAGAVVSQPQDKRWVAVLGQKVLMAEGPQGQIRFELASVIKRFSLWGRGLESLEIMAEENSMLRYQAIKCPLPTTLQSEGCLLPRQVLRVPTGDSQRWVLTSAAPFCIEGIAI